MRQLHVGHDAQGGHGARQEFRPINHELRVDQEHTADAEIPRLQQLYEIAPRLQVCVQLQLAGHVEQDVVIVWVSVHVVVGVAATAQLGFQPLLVADEVSARERKRTL